MKLDKIENKNRRLRKKLYLGEFAILGFEVSCTTSITDFDQYDVFIDEFIDFIDGIGLCFGGGGLELFEGFVCATGTLPLSNRSRTVASCTMAGSSCRGEQS